MLCVFVLPWLVATNGGKGNVCDAFGMWGLRFPSCLEGGEFSSEVPFLDSIPPAPRGLELCRSAPRMSGSQAVQSGCFLFGKLSVMLIMNTSKRDSPRPPQLDFQVPFIHDHSTATLQGADDCPALQASA